jgi:hypothetical protein
VYVGSERGRRGKEQGGKLEAQPEAAQKDILWKTKTGSMCYEPNKDGKPRLSQVLGQAGYRSLGKEERIAVFVGW